MFDYQSLDSVTQILYAICITVMAITIIYRVCELVVEAHQDLDEERENEQAQRLAKKKAQALKSKPCSSY